ncbi:hypothetical protein B0A48_13791 [Cryoendolithus antarcticus]|uniref:U6 snRNA phosphodiesterase n=1 Tax=Cryoendolithus antarcticus TaxID=1507870 RepID=A0A1V8SNI4_9PEZI|nr:hypothetical protein B0A48_13791 [Cryoendolithus antarcticus]
MGLVDYSDSEDEAEVAKNESMPPTKKRKTTQASQDGPTQLPPLPSAFRDLYSSNVRTSVQDDPTLHGGRQRVIPHVEGNWPTHIFIEWLPDQNENYALQESMRLIERSLNGSSRTLPTSNVIHTLLRNDLGVPIPLHVSLSRTLMLKTEQRNAFLARCKAAASSVTAFEMKLETLQWHPNEDRTRWFLVVQVSSPNDALSSLVESLNSVAAEFNQPLLYEDEDATSSVTPSASRIVDSGATTTRVVSQKFHISVAWSLEPPPTAETTDTETVQQTQTDGRFLTRALAEYRGPAKELKVRIGQDVTTIPLRVRRGSALQ